MASAAVNTGRGNQLDDILAELGQCGRYQLLTLALVALPVICSSATASEWIFATARIPSRCYIDQCDEATPQFEADWLQWALPADGVSFSKCLRFANASSLHANTSALADPNLCSAELFDQTQTEPCDSFVYENTNTVVYDFDLGCDEWRRSLIGSVRMLGGMVMLPVTGFVSDRWGRRVAFTACTISMACVAQLRSFATSYEGYLALYVLQSALGGGGVIITCYIIATELVGPKHRVAVGCTMNTIGSLGRVLLGLIAWAVPPWRTLTRVLYAPQLLVLSYFWIFSESVRWLLSKGRYEEAEKILRKVARINNKVLSEKSLNGLRAMADASRAHAPPREMWLPMQVLRSRIILLRCAITPLWWFTNLLVFSGASVNVINLVGNRFLNYIALAAVEIPGYWTAFFLLERMGRKPVLLVFYFLCAACHFAFAFMPEGYYGTTMVVNLVGKFAIAVTTSSVFVYVAELYPTRYRNSFFAFSSMVGRFGVFIAPLTPALALLVWSGLPSVLFGSMALVSGLLTFLTPETLNISLPDTILEAEQLGKRQSGNKI